MSFPPAERFNLTTRERAVADLAGAVELLKRGMAERERAVKALVARVMPFSACPRCHETFTKAEDAAAGSVCATCDAWLLKVEVVDDDPGDDPRVVRDAEDGHSATRSLEDDARRLRESFPPPGRRHGMLDGRRIDAGATRKRSSRLL